MSKAQPGWMNYSLFSLVNLELYWNNMVQLCSMKKLEGILVIDVQSFHPSHSNKFFKKNIIPIIEFDYV